MPRRHPVRVSRRRFLRAAAITTAAAPTLLDACATPSARTMKETPKPKTAPAPGIPLEEATIADLQTAMHAARTTSEALTRAYLDRIAELNPKLHAIIETNPEALEIARTLDAERKAKGARGPLHGIPVVLKDNIGTADRMETTAGSLALMGARPAKDSTVAARLRAAGAVLLAKANLSEWANFRSSHSSSGWSGRGGQGKNPYVLDRTPCGSSSGSAQAASANLGAVSLGTETDGSILCPSAMCGVVGVKPTVGLTSRAGVVPISHTQDTVGPIARTVTDAALVLSAIAGVDPRDPATAKAKAHAKTAYAAALDPKALHGARIGIVREGFFGYSPEADAIAEEAIAAMKSAGAVIVDPANLKDVKTMLAGDAEMEVLLYEFKHDLNAYLASLGPKVRVHTLEELIAFDAAHAKEEMPWFGQDLFVKAQKKGPLTDAAYQKARAETQVLGSSIDAVMEKHRLDALFMPTTSPATTIDRVNGDHYLGGSSTPGAIAGYPSVTVPAGLSFGLPVGMTFLGRAFTEGTLLRLAFAFEQATKARAVPALRPSLL